MIVLKYTFKFCICINQLYRQYNNNACVLLRLTVTAYELRLYVWHLHNNLKPQILLIALNELKYFENFQFSCVEIYNIRSKNIKCKLVFELQQNKEIL